MQEYKREEAKQRKLLRDKKWKMKDGAWKRMVDTTEHVEEAEDKKLAAEQRVQPKEEKTAQVDTTENVEEAEDKKPAAEQRVQPNEEKTAPVDTTENVEEAEDKKPAAKHMAAQQPEANLEVQNISTLEAILVAEKGCKNNEVWDENQSLQWGGTGTSAQEAINITSQSPIADQEKDDTIGYKSKANVYLPDEQIKEELSKAFCSMEDATEDNQRKVKELTGMKQNGNKLVDYVARIDQRPSISGNKKDRAMKALASEI